MSFAEDLEAGKVGEDMELCIEFDSAVCDLGNIIEKGKDYGLDELCGEEEE